MKREQVTSKEAWIVIDRAAALADISPPVTSPAASDWAKHVSDFSQLAKSTGFVTYIAVLGNALLAKATNPRVDVFSLQTKDKSPGAYSARTPADRVLAPAARRYRFDIGAPGPWPLNNSPFYGKLRVTRDIVTDPAAEPLMNQLISLLHEVSLLQQSDALIALEQFIRVRRAYVPVYAPTSSSIKVPSAEEFTASIASFVAERGDGGSRAQAVVGGLFDAVYGPDRVRVAGTNEPDRTYPGDVCILSEGDAEDVRVTRVIEVRDRKVGEDAVLHLIAKVAKAGVHRTAIVAIASGQPHLDEAPLRARARESDVDLEIYRTWEALVRFALSAATAREAQTVSIAVDRVRDRLAQLRVTDDVIEAWDRRTRDAARKGSTDSAAPSVAATSLPDVSEILADAE